MTHSMRLLAVAALVTACGGEKAKPADSTAKVPPAAQASVQPSANPSDTLKPAPSSPSATKVDSSGAAKKAEGPLRDSAFGPKAAVDANGKVVPLQKKKP